MVGLASDRLTVFSKFFKIWQKIDKITRKDFCIWLIVSCIVWYWQPHIFSIDILMCMSLSDWTCFNVQALAWVVNSLFFSNQNLRNVRPLKECLVWCIDLCCVHAECFRLLYALVDMSKFWYIAALHWMCICPTVMLVLNTVVEFLVTQMQQKHMCASAELYELQTLKLEVRSTHAQ